LTIPDLTRLFSGSLLFKPLYLQIRAEFGVAGTMIDAGPGEYAPGFGKLAGQLINWIGATDTCPGGGDEAGSALLAQPATPHNATTSSNGARTANLLALIKRCRVISTGRNTHSARLHADSSAKSPRHPSTRQTGHPATRSNRAEQTIESAEDATQIATEHRADHCRPQAGNLNSFFITSLPGYKKTIFHGCRDHPHAPPKALIR
jgi:hypothetical protein